MAIRFTIFPRFFNDTDKKLDPNKDVNGKGSLERYIESFGQYVDDDINVFIENVQDEVYLPFAILSKYIINRERSLGNEYTLVLLSDDAMRRRILAYWQRFLDIKGTVNGYLFLFQMLGMTATITEFNNTGGFDSDTTFDSDTRPVFDSGRCNPCSLYEIELTGDPLTPQLEAGIFSIIEFNEPINAQLISVTYNGFNITNPTFNWAYMTATNGIHNPVFSKPTGAVMKFEFDGGIQVDSNTPSFNYPDGTTKIVNAIVNTFTEVEEIDMSAQEIVGTLDLSDFVNVFNYQLNNNQNGLQYLQEIIFPTTTTNVNELNCSFTDCAAFDFSGLQNLGGFIFLSGNAQAGSVQFSGTQSTNPTDLLLCDNIGVGTMNLGGLLFGVNSQVTVINCTQMVTLITATVINNNNIAKLDLFNNNDLLELDISRLRGGIAELRINNNSSLTTFLVGGGFVRPSQGVVEGKNTTSLSGQLDLSSLPIAIFDFSGSGVGSFLHVSSPAPVTFYDVSDCLNLSYYDITMLSGLMGADEAYFSAKDCLLSATEVDRFLADLVDICITQRGEPVGGSFAARVIELDGNNNAPTANGLIDVQTLRNLNITVKTN